MSEHNAICREADAVEYYLSSQGIELSEFATTELAGLVKASMDIIKEREKSEKFTRLHKEMITKLTKAMYED